MGKFKNTLMEILAHDECYGAGWLFTGNAIDYDVEKCECKNFALGNLFTTKEND